MADGEQFIPIDGASSRIRQIAVRDTARDPAEWQFRIYSMARFLVAKPIQLLRRTSSQHSSSTKYTHPLNVMRPNKPHYTVNMEPS